ncbi:HAMP domain-containing sensor histidine kinase [Chitinophaga sp. MM2321]|uniref:HAMP domain-containing sensor histidine kinase n=1 Tax=Chitinophaga sp. MM2321 TaxID=3137178 RepID=UPI0032D58E0C
MLKNKIGAVSDRFKRVFNFLVGFPDEVSFENRNFNSICIIALLVILFNIPFDIIIGLKATTYLLLGMFVALASLYYLSRFRNKPVLSMSISIILINALFGVNYFFSSGIEGSSLLIYTLTFFLIMLVSPRQYGWWLLLNLLVVTCLVIYEYYHPESIPRVYSDRSYFFADLMYAYVTGIMVIFCGTLYLKRVYNTEKQKGEEKNKVLESMNTEKNKLFSIISHDLRSPMANIQSYLELMKDMELPQEDKKQLEAELLQMVNNTQEMLYNMLSWSKTQLQGLAVNLAPVNIAEAVTPILKINDTLISKKKITLQHQIDPSLEAIADLNMLQLIIRNIIGNAIKFTPAGGSIYIRADKQGDECILTVEDTGTGIDPRWKEEIFSLKARSTFGTGNEKGIGLGLYLCKEYTAAQHGRIWFEPNRKVGSAFYLALPTRIKG